MLAISHFNKSVEEEYLVLYEDALASTNDAISLADTFIIDDDPLVEKLKLHKMKIEKNFYYKSSFSKNKEANTYRPASSSMRSSSVGKTRTRQTSAGVTRITNNDNNGTATNKDKVRLANVIFNKKRTTAETAHTHNSEHGSKSYRIMSAKPRPPSPMGIPGGNSVIAGGDRPKSRAKSNYTSNHFPFITKDHWNYLSSQNQQEKKDDETVDYGLVDEKLDSDEDSVVMNKIDQENSTQRKHKLGLEGSSAKMGDKKNVSVIFLGKK